MATHTFGRYQLLKKLATGGMAEVWLARQHGIEGFQKLTVLKRILPHLADDPEFVKMFKHEALIAARFNHPNIAQIYEFGEANGTYFIAMEFVHGEDLGRVMRKAWSSGQWIPQPLAIRIVAAACEALYYAHSKLDESGRPLKVVHRDISPQNILISFDGSVKVVDFGIAKAADQASLTKSGAIKGKFAYMAPEQAAGKPLDARSDIYAIGLVLYELLTGVRPLKRDNEIATLQAALEADVPLPSTQADCPKHLDKVVMKALARAADDRYRDARQFQMELEEFLVSQRWVASSVQISEMMATLFKERIEEEARLGRPEPDSESLAAGTPLAPPPPQRDRSPPTEQGAPGWEAPPGAMEPSREKARTQSGSRTLAKGTYARSDPGQRSSAVAVPDVPDWEAPPATEYDGRRNDAREPTLMGRSRSQESVASRAPPRGEATQIARSRSDTGIRRSSQTQVPEGRDLREEEGRYAEDAAPRTSSRSASRTQVPRRRVTGESARAEGPRRFEQAGASEDPEATRLPDPELDSEPPPREPTRIPRRQSRASVVVAADVAEEPSHVSRRLSRVELIRASELTPEQKYGVAPKDDDAAPTPLPPGEALAIERALAKEKQLQRAKRVFFAALAIAVAIVVAVFHKPLVAALIKKPIDSAGIFVTLEANIPLQVYARHPPSEGGSVKESLLGEAPLRGAPGAHLQDTLVLVNSELGARREIEITFGQPGEVKTYREEFKRGYLKLNVTPRSIGKLSVLRDGKAIASFRQGLRLALMEGTHELELSGPQLSESKKISVVVKRDETTESEPIDLSHLIH